MITDQRITRIVDKWLTPRHKDETRSLLTASLQRYSSEMIDLLDGLPASDETLRKLKYSVSAENPENEIREELCLFPYLQDAHYASARLLIRSLHTYPGLPASDDFSREDNDVQQTCVALLTVTKWLLDRDAAANFHGNTLRDTTLVQLLVSSGDRTDHVVGLIRAHLNTGAKTVDVPLIQEMLHSSTLALSHGML